MFYLIIAIAVVVLALVAYAASRHERPGAPPEDEHAAGERPEGCCGQHEVCEKESLLAAVSREVEYYDDEELDRFRTRAETDYTAAEEEEFRSIFYTMRTDEVAGWVRSLQLRGIALPAGVKDEVLLIVSERRYDA